MVAGFCGDYVFFCVFCQDIKRYMDIELTKVVSTLQKANIPLGAGIAIHHLGSWEKLIKKENRK